MTWQKGTSVFCAGLILLLAQSSSAVPQNLAYYTHLLPAQQIVAQSPVVPQSSNLVLLPQGIAGIANHQQYAAAVPGRVPVSGQQYVVLLRQEKEEGNTEKPGVTEKPDGGWFNFQWPSFIPSLPSIPGFGGGDSTTASPGDQPANAPVDNSKPGQGSPAKLEELEPASPAMPAAPAPAPAPDSVASSPDQRFILGQPQYYGTYEGLKRLGVKNLGNKGVIPNFLLVRGSPGVHHLGGKPEPEKIKDLSNAGTAALAFQRYLEEQRQVASGADHAAHEIQKYLEQQKLADSSSDLGSIVVNADRRGGTKKDDGEAEEDGEDIEANNPHGPSVAQVKPQAIALAGPGGVAASAPVGTALVGPGGLAVAAPAATAVAGPSGGAPPVVAPAQRILEAYFKRQENKGYVALTR
ncbi:uncharacterized protein [Anabrus simplex]|uniref:uncharacterized protein n=1 Tax=Anabrus simplex TaxID=316456 RepID=UPI0035A35812